MRQFRKPLQHHSLPRVAEFRIKRSRDYNMFPGSEHFLRLSFGLDVQSKELTR